MGIKNIVVLFFVVIIPWLQIFPQFEDIQLLPTGNKYPYRAESIPIAISESEIIIIHTDRSYDLPDTLYLTRSTDGGNNWQESEYIQEVILYGSRECFSATRTYTGKIMICWSDIRYGGIRIISSTDNGLVWSDTSFIQLGSGIPGDFQPEKFTFNLIADDRIILTFSNYSDNKSYFIESTDDGQTWSEKNLIQPHIFHISILDLPGEGYSEYFEYQAGIFKRISDDGITWGELKEVINSEQSEERPRIVRFSETDLWLFYQVRDSTYIYNGQSDIFYIRSTDGGESWSEAERFTSYVGEDIYTNVVNFNGKPFITFASKRFSDDNYYRICYAVPGITVEVFRPPVISDIDIDLDSSNNKSRWLSCKIIDDEEIASSKIVVEDEWNFEMFDDGKHNDRDSADSFFGAKISIVKYPPSPASILDVNKINLNIKNNGELAEYFPSIPVDLMIQAIDVSSFTAKYKFTPSLTFYDIRQYEEGNFLFSGGFGLSGFTDANLWACGQQSSYFLKNFNPGGVGSDPDDPLNVIYTIYADDPPFGYSWQNWREAVSIGADFYDGDKDGIYNPVDKNFNGTWDINEDMPDLLGDETTWCVFNDGVTDRIRFNATEPQGIEISQAIFASAKPELEDIIFIRYKITNRGTKAASLDSVIFSFVLDPDLGDYHDDLGGTDTLLNSSFIYNDNIDGIYGSNPPAFFVSLLQGPQVETLSNPDTAVNNRGYLLGHLEYSGMKNLKVTASVLRATDEWEVLDETDFRNLGTGLKGNGVMIDPCENNYSEVRGGIDCSEVNPIFWFSGDPVADLGWIHTNPFDLRSILSTGEFTLEKDKPVTIIAAYVLGRGTDHLNSITVARENVQRAIEEYESNFASMTYVPPPETNPVSSYLLHQNYPNPFNPRTTIRYEVLHDGIVTLKIYDILGQEVKTLLNEFKKADRYQLDFNADGLASGVYIYRMMVNDFVESKKMLLIK